MTPCPHCIGAGLFGLINIIAIWKSGWRPWKRMTRYTPDDTFNTHECILCKNDPDASYCIPNPNKEIQE